MQHSWESDPRVPSGTLADACSDFLGSYGSCDLSPHEKKTRWQNARRAQGWEEAEALLPHGFCASPQSSVHGKWSPPGSSLPLCHTIQSRPVITMLLAPEVQNSGALSCQPLVISFQEHRDFLTLQRGHTWLPDVD